MLAEIADKMGTVAGCWILAGILTVPFLYAAFRVGGKIGMAVVLFLAAGLSVLLIFAAVWESFLESDFSLLVRDEMGANWIAHRIASGCLPVVLVSIALALRRRWTGRK